MKCLPLPQERRTVIYEISDLEEFIFLRISRRKDMRMIYV